MDFFGAQAQARRDSRLLSWLFAACMAAVVFVLGMGALAALRVLLAAGDPPQPMEASLGVWMARHPGVVVVTLLGIAGLIGGASLWRMLQLREGGGYVARGVGGVRVERSAQDPRRRQLHNVVEEMAIASGVPVPEVYVLEQEDGINAFAAGHSADNAAIAVTRGALTRLNREQLQGVIGHEFSHVLNGDIRISIRLMGMIFGLMVVMQAGRMLFRAARHGEKSGAFLIVIGGLLAIVGYFGWLFGRLLQAWISRRREALADASAVQFTRNSEGLKEALVRIAAMGEFRRPHAGLEQVAHMLFNYRARSFFATHPPLLERLQALDPSITVERLESLKRQALKRWQLETEAAPEGTPDAAGPAAQRAGGMASPSSSSLPSSLPLPVPMPLPVPLPLPAAVAVPAAAELIAASTGDPAPRHLEQAVALRGALPAELRATAEDPEGAEAILLSLLIFGTPGDATRPLSAVTERLGARMASRVQQLAEVNMRLAPLLRLPAVLQLIPALRSLPPAQRLQFMQLLRELTRLDGSLSVFEYALEKLALRALRAQQQPRPAHGNRSLAECEAELGVVFAVLARSGARDGTQARQCYEAGLAPLLPRHRPGYGVIDDWVPLFDAALDKLCELRVAAKQLLIEGLVRTIAHDGMLAPEEAELLRAVCAVLECPLPPVLPAAETLVR